jgi:hypothetical protein
VSVAVALLQPSSGRTADIGELDLRCRSLLHRYVFDCTCTAEFLDAHLGPEQADALMKLWIYGVNGDNRRHEIVNVYFQHGRKTVDEAVMAFHRHRDRLAAFCGESGPGVAD